MPKSLQDMVVVITGASSGIGRTTAHAFAKQGATVVLAARSEASLRDAATECEQQGGKALIVPTDVTDEAAVNALAQQARDAFGHVDVWVNDAAVILFGRFTEAPSDAYQHVIETNLFGTIHGARAALRLFQDQGHGTLINIASVESKIGVPYASAYAISKHGIRALSECLRQEMALVHAKDIHICAILPATIDTPLFQHAANYTGFAAQAMPPVYAPERVAQTVLNCVRRPRREVAVGGASRMFQTLHALMPAVAERMMAFQVDKTHLNHAVVQAATAGNLFTPLPQLDAPIGGWKQPRARQLPQWLRKTPGQVAATAVTTAGIAGACLFLVRGR